MDIMSSIRMGISVGGISVEQAKRVGLFEVPSEPGSVDCHAVFERITEESFVQMARQLYRRAYTQGLTRGVTENLMIGTLSRHD
jgi:hypothetical protein